MTTPAAVTAEGVDTRWRQRSLLAVFLTALVAQNALAIPYVQRNGPASVKDFFVGDILKTTPGRFAMVDLTFVVIGFHVWAFSEARRLRILPWWLASVVLTFGVGIATAIPFFFLARERALSPR
ncbi:DUF2834 domain-containing protein [Gordonia sp. zg691]|uniref:DUF2834 domain-containing protein n=1 Tax=Gordonia jinghuaiqii TaxID=2758710 RepID=A0A7D7QHE9_9ACTN|nr:DUF2834 domain-containing protein [Gordonia jinghuaiqii]MBD0862262.1 DUF2834 domain-containing protein [Gordonia jinghuaiqii]MCR5978514.1 DUF2834 domain-containing protein [Gordonia jinghuaiqii]QMT02842.1 DUF2834 domain-containing protein [Gordonia jinghuaiqii]